MNCSTSTPSESGNSRLPLDPAAADPVQQASIQYLLAHPTWRRLERVLPERERRAAFIWLSTFFDFQLAWLLDWSKFSILLKARGIGASHTYAAAAVLWGLIGEKTVIISVGDREATEVLDKTKLHAGALVRFGSQWAAKTRDNESQLQLVSGGRVESLPATSAARGYTANVLLDEFAFHHSPQKVWDAAGPATRLGHRGRVFSTPNGVGNLFHNMWTQRAPELGWTRHEVTIDQAIAAGLQVDLQEKWQESGADQRIFDQNFRCSFLDGDQQYIPTEYIERAVYAGPPPILDGHIYAGLDVGRTNDLTVLAIVKKAVDGVVYVASIKTCKRTAWDEQISMVLGAHAAWGFERLSVDATGIGSMPAETLQKHMGRHRVEPVDFTMGSKEELATLLFQHFAQGTLAIPDDQALRQDVAAIRRIVTAAGNVTYDAPRTSEGHADRAWALALALRACQGAAGAGARRTYGPGDFRGAAE